MKFSNWKLEDLIEHLQQLRHSSDFDYKCVTRVSGELRIFNGETKDGQPREDIWG